MAGPGSLGGDQRAADLHHLVGTSFLDWNILACGGVRVYRGERRYDIKWNIVMPGKDGKAVGADLISRVSISRDAVRSHQDGGDFLRGHDMSGHVVGDERRGD